MASLLRIALLASCLLPLAPAQGNDSAPAFHRGFHLTAWTREEWLGEGVESQLAALEHAGVRSVALNPHWFQAERGALEIAPDPLRSPSDESLRSVMAAAWRTGLSVFVKPQIELPGEGWRGEIAFESEADWARWFRSYELFIVHYARIAQEGGAALFCVGVELDGTRHREADWRRVIATVRKHYSGPLTFAANWRRERDITWWDALDLAGVDAYFPLAKSGAPELESLRAAWAEHREELRAWSRAIDRPVLFTEVGYRSVYHAAVEPWEWKRSGAPAPALQARLYRATLATFYDEPWFAGFYWWQWRSAPPADALADTGFTPQDKPAADELRDVYGRKRNLDASSVHELPSTRSTRSQRPLRAGATSPAPSETP